MMTDYSLGTSTVTFKPGDQPDTAIVAYDFTLRDRQFYLNNYAYKLKQNEVELGYLLRKYHPRLQKMNFDETRFGWAHRYNKTQSLKFIQQDFKKVWNGFSPSVKWSWSDRYIEPNCSEAMQKTSLTVKRDFRSED
jgi:hypothetical protein